MRLTKDNTISNRWSGSWDWGGSYMLRQEGGIGRSWPEGQFVYAKLFDQWILQETAGRIL